MGAYVYRETWSRTQNSNKPVTYYVISYFCRHKNPNHQERGCYETRSVDENRIREEVMKIRRQGNTSVFGKLPPHTSPVETKVLEEDPRESSVRITREPYDLSSLVMGSPLK